MSVTFKRTLAVPVVATAVILPALSVNAVSAQAATIRGAATVSQAAAATRSAAATRDVAATRRHRHSRRIRAYIWAAHQHGKPYCWGGTGGCFDCSGLVMAAYRHVDLHFGRDTAQMLASSRLVRVSHRRARKGDLAFYGSGHVELVAGRRYTLGALHAGTRVGWHRASRWWHPTMYFRVRHAG